MIGEVLKTVPAPTGGRDWQASLNRNRLIQQGLMAKAVDAAEREWPGFLDLLTELIEAELTFMEKAGPQC
jgi:hypothetical protein